MHTQLRRTFSAVAVAAFGTLAAWSANAADAPKSIRIGYAVSLSGVNAQGAATTTLPGYDLWVKDVNDAGGISLSRAQREEFSSVVHRSGDSLPGLIRQLQVKSTELAASGS